MFVRRHHCRRCGRIFCERCCPRSIIAVLNNDDRVCVICAKVLELDTGLPNPPQECSIDQYIRNDQVAKAMASTDVVLQSEVIRLFQNLCRANTVREQLMQWPPFFQRIRWLLERCADFYEHEEGRHPFFQASSLQLNADIVNTALSNCAGGIINFAASPDGKYAKFACQQELLPRLLRLLGLKLDLVRRTTVAWAVRNLASVRQAAELLRAERDAVSRIIGLLAEDQAGNANEHCLAILGNICKHGPDDVRRAVARKQRKHILGLPDSMAGKGGSYAALLYRLFAYLSAAPDIRGQITRGTSFFAAAAVSVSGAVKAGSVDISADLSAAGAIYAFSTMLELAAEDPDASRTMAGMIAGEDTVAYCVR